MNTRPITAALVLFLLCAITPVSLAQKAEEVCSARETVYPVVMTAILDDPSHQGVHVRHANPWERLDIIGSTRGGPWCWLQVSDGWLIERPSFLSEEPYVSTVDQARFASHCYSGARAYVFGNMNIRAGASTGSPVVAKAGAGDVFEVLHSIIGQDWCWLKLDQGWLANTARVGSTTIPISGSSRFVHQVEAALDWLETTAPEWHNYVIDGVDKVFELANSDPNGCWAYAYTDERHVGVETCNSNIMQEGGLNARQDQLNLAMVLVHEACHIHRHEAGFVYNAATRYHEETECIKREYGVKVALDPYEWYGEITNRQGESALDVVKRLCLEESSPELYCPSIDRLQGG